MSQQTMRAKKLCFTGYEWFICPVTSETSPTGREMVFLAETIEKAVDSCLYAERLRNRAAKVGPTGRVVYNGNYSIVFTNPK